MKKYIILFFIGIGFLGSYFFYNHFPSVFSDEIPEVERAELDASDALPVEVFHPARPVSISIPSLEVVAHVESVGKDGQGRMDVPGDVLNAAWYNLGALPGEAGNSVIAAHYDTPNGSPSVFYGIDTLSIGDEIVVTDENSLEFIFKVTDVITYDNNNFPIKTVFGDHEKKRLNLITCAGIFDELIKDYTDRTVVFSELSEVRGV